MSQERGASGKYMVDGYVDNDCMLSGLRALMQSKYGDIILLCSVMLAFLIMLALSAAS
jgi:putative copper export protein